jgi:hypothetical protein
MLHRPWYIHGRSSACVVVNVRGADVEDDPDVPFSIRLRYKLGTSILGTLIDVLDVVVAIMYAIEFVTEHYGDDLSRTQYAVKAVCGVVMCAHFLLSLYIAPKRIAFLTSTDTALDLISMAPLALLLLSPPYSFWMKLFRVGTCARLSHLDVLSRFIVSNMKLQFLK